MNKILYYVCEKMCICWSYKHFSIQCNHELISETVFKLKVLARKAQCAYPKMQFSPPNECVDVWQYNGSFFFVVVCYCSDVS